MADLRPKRMRIDEGKDKETNREKKMKLVGVAEKKLVHAGLMLDSGFGCVYGCPEVID